MFCYDLAVIGAGSGAAYYLNTLDAGSYSNILLVGDADPWAGTRGTNAGNPRDPVNIVNHTAQMIGHYGDSVPPYTSGGYHALVPRTKWAQQNAAVIGKALARFGATNFKQVPAKVTMVKESVLAAFQSKGKHKRAFQISTADGMAYFAFKLIIASGAGGHRAPEEVKDARAGRPDLVMDMDAFARKVGSLPRNGQTVFVMGGNAGIDTVETARFNGFRVVWLMRGKQDPKTKKLSGSKPVLLGTKHQVHAEEQPYINYQPGSLKVRAEGNRLRVEFFDIEVKHQNARYKNEVRWGEFFVYATGQDDREAISFLHPDLQKELEPILDVNQRFGDAHESVLGFHLEGTTLSEGIDIVGALSAQVAKHVDISKWTRASLRPYEEGIETVVEKILDTGAIVTAIGQVSGNRCGLLQAVEDAQDLITIRREGDAVVNRLSTDHPKNPHLRTWVAWVRSLVNLRCNYHVMKVFCDTSSLSRDQKAALWNTLLDNPANQLGSSVLQGPQLGTVRSATAAVNGFVPSYVGTETASGDVNFSHDDRTVLRVYIAANYPLVSEADAEQMISQVLAGRKTAGKGWGYEPYAVSQFKNKLNQLNQTQLHQMREKN
jgi:hypothetical protein